MTTNTTKHITPRNNTDELWFFEQQQNTMGLQNSYGGDLIGVVAWARSTAKKFDILVT